MLRTINHGLVPLTVFEDRSTEETHEVFEGVCEQYRTKLVLKPSWGGMQGILQFAVENTPEDWIVYIPDDVLPTPGAYEQLLAWIRTVPDFVGLIQMPYWNYEDLEGSGPRWEMFPRSQKSLDWLKDVPWNPYWWGPALYLNVNGAGFALRRKVWEQVGGWDLRTWCLDEYIAYKMWTETQFVCVSLPGPAWVHGGGLSTPAQHALGHQSLREATNEGWMDAVGVSKDTCSGILREIMRVRSGECKWPAR